MATNKEFELRRDDSVAKAIAYSSTFIADRAENTEIWDVEGKRYIDFVVVLVAKTRVTVITGLWTP